MSRYFDALATDVRQLVESARQEQASDDWLVDQVALVENRMIQQVLLNTGDREFPEDLREKAMGLIATLAVKADVAEAVRPTQGREWLLLMSTSKLISEMHSLFHEVASRQIRTRFGLLFDDPAANLVARETWEEGASEVERQI